MLLFDDIMNSPAAAFLLVKKERERASKASNAEKTAQGETLLLLSKLEEVERERGNLLTEMEILRDKQSNKVQEVAQREIETSTYKESISRLENREKELMVEIEDLYATTIERERAGQAREREREEKIKILESELSALREREAIIAVEREQEQATRNREKMEAQKRMEAEEEMRGREREREIERDKAIMEASLERELQKLKERERNNDLSLERERKEIHEEQVHLLESEAKLLKIQELLQKELSKSRLLADSLQQELQNLTLERDALRGELTNVHAERDRLAQIVASSAESNAILLHQTQDLRKRAGLMPTVRQLEADLAAMQEEVDAAAFIRSNLEGSLQRSWHTIER